jgi:hypothetical protein
MKIEKISPIPKCCGSCASFGTINGARCHYHGPTFSMGLCPDYRMKDEYASQQAVEADAQKPCVWCKGAPIEGDGRLFCHRCGRDLRTAQLNR